MAGLHWAGTMTIARTSGVAEPCYEYAVTEIVRLLGRIGIPCVIEHLPERGGSFRLQVLAPNVRARKDRPSLKPVRSDGYLFRVSDGSVDILARQAKGVLNGVYDLAEQLGFLFLFPGEEGEWAPDRPPGGYPPLRAGSRVCNSRFPFRGVFSQLSGRRHTGDEWVKFYAKLRFNALACNPDLHEAARRLGFRVETGGHGLPELLPRDLFKKHPEYFRLEQPEDFYGRRRPDHNLCVTNPRARRVVQTALRKKLASLSGVHAVHLWADDLPGGGWCFCPSCRSLSPADQSMLAMRTLAEAARQAGSRVRIPVIAYHDTLFPGDQIDAPEQGFLLYAPRERCYAHALGDPACRRNRFFLRALRQWMAKFRGIDDAHTFEYYCDQILYRNLYPFIPGVILDDLRVYERNGIETHLALQVGGEPIGPEWNMLVFSRGLWDRRLTAARFISRVAERVVPGNPAAFREYLAQAERAAGGLLKLCGYSTDIYFDYRWLPETSGGFGKAMARTYAESARRLRRSAAALSRAVAKDWPARARNLAAGQSAVAGFQAAEAEVMACQQRAASAVGAYHNTGSPAALREAVRALRLIPGLIAAGRARARKAGFTPGHDYGFAFGDWIGRETGAKAEQWGKELLRVS